MFASRLKVAAGMLTLGLLVGGALVDQARALAPDDRDTAAGLSPVQFDRLRALIRPLPGGFDDLSWMTDLWEARKKAAAEGKPLLVWVGDGHPLGWT
jgi:hypothetical protein